MRYLNFLWLERFELYLINVLMGGLGVCCQSRKELDGLDAIDQDIIMRRSTYGELSSMDQANEF